MPGPFHDNKSQYADLFVCFFVSGKFKYCTVGISLIINNLYTYPYIDFPSTIYTTQKIVLIFISKNIASYRVLKIALLFLTWNNHLIFKYRKALLIFTLYYLYIFILFLMVTCFLIEYSAIFQKEKYEFILLYNSLDNTHAESPIIII